MDESGFSLTPSVAKTWAPANEVPVLLHALGAWEKPSAISGVAVRWRRGRLGAELYFRLLPGKAVRNGDMADYLRQLARHLRGPVLVVWDNAGQHRGPALRAFFHRHTRFEAVRLPPYCPELNPDEAVWNWVKWRDLANLCAEDDEELVRHVRGSLRRLQRRRSLLEGYIRGSELPWGRLPNLRGGG